jgi:hypothetical protein
MDLLPFEYWQSFLFVLKIVAAALTVILIGEIIYFLRNSGYIMFYYGSDLRDFFMVGAGASKKIAKQWTAITRRINSANDSDWKLAIIEGDKFVDDVVRHLGGQGNTLGERLNSLPPGTIQNLDELWSAHKVRNNIVHDPDYRLTQDKAKEVVGQYEKVLKEFEVF